LERILVVEDELKIARTVRLYLQQAGYEVIVVDDGAMALPAFRSELPDLVILDLMLPHADGYEICRKIRQTSGVPIIMLTARTEETDRIVGLELGADDYVTKPFSPRELTARVRAVLRRSQGHIQASQVLRARGIVVDLDRRNASSNGCPLDLTPFELLILAEFVRQPGRVLTRLQLLEQLGDIAYEGYDRVIDQHIKNLRAKLGDDARHPRYIATIYGTGYKLLEESTNGS
jgi:two-component system, OmpR family, alkaline phosphatase synthesis response regulator PhoP